MFCCCLTAEVGVVVVVLEVVVGNIPNACGGTVTSLEPWRIIHLPVAL